MHTRLEPKLLTVLREDYTRRQFFSDLTAGLTVGVVALPLAIAFAIASGVKPEQGLYTAIGAGFVIAVLGGSRAQISGPTGAFIVVAYNMSEWHYFMRLFRGSSAILMTLIQSLTVPIWSNFKLSDGAPVPGAGRTSRARTFAA